MRCRVLEWRWPLPVWLTFLFSGLPHDLSIAIEVIGFLAELSLCLWLLVMGVNVER
jgi:hypothetical protein